MIKSKRRRWAGLVARMRIRGIHARFWWENQKDTATKTGMKKGGSY
jgi:hypothetical protein